MSILFFILSFLLLQGICLWVGRRSSKKIKNQDDYFLAGRGVRFFPLMMTFVATQIGGGLILGSAEEAFKYGWIVLLYPLGQALGFVALALGLGKRMSRFKISTVAQIFEVVYHSSRLKKVASLLSIASLFFILVAQVIASKKFMLSLGLESNTIFLLFWGVVIVYTVMGGLKAVIATDIVQALFFIFIFAGTFFFTFFTLPESHIEATSSSGNFVWDSSKLMGWLLMPLLFMIIEQDMGQRCFAAKSGKTVSWASGITALIIISLSTIPIFYGIFGKIHGIEIDPGTSVFLGVTSQISGPFLTAFVASAILAAIISTADSLINAISSNVAQDFGSNKNLKQMRRLTAVLSIIALILSFAFNNVVDLMIWSYELSVSALFIPIFMALFIKQGNALTATLSIIFGACSFLIFQFVKAPFLPRECLSLFASALGYGIGVFYLKLTSKTEDVQVL